MCNMSGMCTTVVMKLQFNIGNTTLDLLNINTSVSFSNCLRSKKSISFLRPWDTNTSDGGFGDGLHSTRTC
jgi:hypothetical protein